MHAVGTTVALGVILAVACSAAMGAEEVMVPMRDGVRLHTKIWRPTGPGPFPVVFTMLCQSTNDG